MTTTQNYSLANLVRCLSNPDKNQHQCLETARSNRLAQRDRDDGLPSLPGHVIPSRALKSRALEVSTFNSGGAFVSQNVSDFSDSLRARTVCGRLGARFFTKLRGDQVVPAGTSGSSGQWLAEGETMTDSEMTLSGVTLSPHRVSARIPITSQLLRQSDQVMEAVLSRDIIAAVSTALDTAALSGSGVSAAPLGILNTDGVEEITFGGAATADKLLEMEEAAGLNDSQEISPGWVTTPAARRKLKQLARVSGGSTPCWHDFRLLDSPAESTTGVDDNRIIFGDFSQLVLATWGEGPSILVDPFSMAENAIVVLTVNLHADVGLIQPSTFAVSTDSAAQ